MFENLQQRDFPNQTTYAPQITSSRVIINSSMEQKTFEGGSYKPRGVNPFSNKF